jgi:hypothetical protein
MLEKRREMEFQKKAKAANNDLHGSENDMAPTSFTQLLTEPITIDMLTVNLF